MIISYNDLASHRQAVSMVDGAFDPLHAGHIEYFEQAASLGLPVLCNLASDRYLEGKHYPVLPQPERAKVIDGLKPIAYVHPNAFDTETVRRSCVQSIT